MNAKFLAESGEAFDEREQSYLLVRYEITGGDRLTLWTMSEDVVAGDIRAGKVEGTVEKGRWVTTVRLTAERDDLIEYLRGSGPERLFGAHLATFRRVR